MSFATFASSTSIPLPKLKPVPEGWSTYSRLAFEFHENGLGVVVPPLPSPSVFGRGLADHGLPLPSPTGSPYVFAPRELEGIFLPPPEGAAALRGTPSRV